MTSFVPTVDERSVHDLLARLERTRLPEQETGPDQGLALADLTRLLGRWRSGYSFDRLAARLTSVAQVRLEVDGLGTHAVHERSGSADAPALLLAHGWPSTCFEFLDLLPLLRDFHVVCPSLPGYGFSDRPTESGWDARRTADGWVSLMGQLGYDRFLVHGGDWGALIATELAVRHPQRVLGLHLTMPVAPVEDADLVDLSTFEQHGAERTAAYRRRGYAYAQVQRTRPQTIGYGLVDSPVALLAWVGEKLLEWCDRDERGRPLIDDDAALDVVTVYWLTATGASSARMYAEALRGDRTTTVSVPTGCTIFPAEVIRTPRTAVARRFTDLRRWSEQPRGGHFPALEVPGALAAEVAAFAAEVTG